MYESPINKLTNQIADEFVKWDENNMMCTITKTIGYQVDKYELLKALDYDRKQYEKGYNDAKREFKTIESYWLKLPPNGVRSAHMAQCVNCCRCSPITDYCPHCGAKMIRVVEEIE